MAALISTSARSGSSSYASIIARGGDAEGGYLPMLLNDGILALEGGSITGTATLGIPALLAAGRSLQGECVIDPDFLAAHPDLTVYAAMNASSLNATERIDVGLNANVPVDPITGIPIWGGSVWDVFSQTGTDLSQANAAPPHVVTAAGGLFFFQFVVQIQWTL